MMWKACRLEGLSWRALEKSDIMGLSLLVGGAWWHHHTNSGRVLSVDTLLEQEHGVENANHGGHRWYDHEWDSRCGMRVREGNGELPEVAGSWRIPLMPRGRLPNAAWGRGR